jgi:hypothetical protein
MYLTRFVKEKQLYQAVANVVESMGQSELAGGVRSPGRFASAVTRMMGEAAASKADAVPKSEPAEGKLEDDGLAERQVDESERLS